MVLAVLISAAFFMAGIGAYYLVKGRALPFARRSVSIAVLAGGLGVGYRPVGTHEGHSPSGEMHPGVALIAEPHDFQVASDKVLCDAERPVCTT